jgi:FkbM family methyltransferase
MDVSVTGLKMRCHLGDNNTEDKLVAKGVSRHRALAAILPHLKGGETFLDIGANCGLFTLYAARAVGPNGRVIAVEPMPAMIERLQFNVKTNGFTNVAVVECAVGDTAGTATLHVQKFRRGSSSILPADTSFRLQVPMMTLLDLCRKLGVRNIDSMKIDIEGFEDRALMPFLETAPASMWPRVVLVETSHNDRWHIDCVAAMVERSYRKVWEGRGDCLLERSDQMNLERSA